MLLKVLDHHVVDDEPELLDSELRVATGAFDVKIFILDRLERS